jgi:hypothetical protein
VLKYPIIRDRIPSLLNQDTFKDEFSHTILHGQNVFDEFKAKKQQMKEEEEAKKREEEERKQLE